MKNNSGKEYEVAEKVAETVRYRLYLCRPAGEAWDHLLQVATNVEYNGSLDRSAYILGRLAQEAELVEEAYAKVKKNPKHFVNYNLSFPELVDTFVPSEQGGRRVNILRFRGVDDVRTVVPLHNLVHRDKLRVDLRTSVWIMGKLLKILAFVHEAKIAVGDLTLNNILIEPDKHYVILFNWADAQLLNEGVPRSTVREEISNAALRVWEVLDGTSPEGIPDNGSSEHLVYKNHLTQLAINGESKAADAHRSFYEMVDQLWPKGFHPFTTLPRR